MRVWISVVKASLGIVREGNDCRALLVDRWLLRLTCKFLGSLTVLQRWNRIQALGELKPPFPILGRSCKRFKSCGLGHWALVGRSLGTCKQLTKPIRLKARAGIWRQLVSSNSGRWCLQLWKESQAAISISSASQSASQSKLNAWLNLSLFGTSCKYNQCQIGLNLLLNASKCKHCPHTAGIRSAETIWFVLVASLCILTKVDRI